MSAKKNLILDITILAAFLVVSDPALTGETIHEWFALAFGAAIVTHLLFHWNWLVTVTKQYFKKLFHQSRLNYVVNALFFIAVTSTILSGLMISKSVLAALGIQLGASQGWRAVHNLSADAALIMLGIHFALHGKWVLTHLKRYIANPIANLFQRGNNPTLATRPVRIDESN